MRKILLSVVLLIVSGCSAVESLKSSNTQNLLIDTPHVDGAECALSDKTGRKWRLLETPGTVAIQEGHPPLVIICTKKGFKKSVLTINEHKEEVLTIDGKRVDFSIYGDFPTRFPRVIPAAIKEAAGFMQDPTGSISTTYPNKIIVWMEPKKWESEEQMREWALDMEIQDNTDFIAEEEAKLTEEQRKEKRRAEKKKREEYIKKVKKRLQDGGKKGVKNTLKVLNPTPAVNSIAEKGRAMITPDKKDPSALKTTVEATKSAIKKGMDGITPGSAVDALNERNEVRDRVRKSRVKDSDDEIGETDFIEPMDDSYKEPARTPDKVPYVPYKKYNEMKKEKKVDDSSPQDLYDDEYELEKIDLGEDKKIQYDDKGYRIAPWKADKGNTK